MKLVEYLSLVLQKHGAVLLELKNRYSESILVEILERQQKVDYQPFVPELASSEVAAYESFPYEILEQTVKNIKLPAGLEFYIWAYPYYREFIESPLKLDQTLFTQDTILVQKLSKDAILFSEAWALSIPAKEPFKSEITRVVTHHWKGFEKDVSAFMKRLQLKLV